MAFIRSVRALLAVTAPLGAALAFSAGGCSTGTSTSSGGVGAVQSEVDYCTRREERVKSCAPDGSTPGPVSRDGCGRDYRCAQLTMIDPASYLACRTTTDCAQSVSDDKCLGVVASAAISGKDQADACAKKVASCGDEGKRFDETCPLLPAFNADALAKLAACLDRPCDQIDDCFEATYEALSPDCR
ncbi:MAG: hypothetical protein KF819_15305 [Labilithrix sp.]|nr:hypothetical protein [Labilithrix sp.]